MSVALLQSANKSAGAVTSSTQAFGSNITAGSLKICHDQNSTNAATLTASDNVDGSYGTDVATLSNATPPTTAALFSKANATAGATTVTFTGTGGSQLRCVIEEFSGIATSAPLDQIGSSQSGAGTTGTPSIATSGATTQAIELVVAAFHIASTQTFTAGGSYTADVNSNARIGVEWLVTSSTGTQTATATLGVATNNVLMIATYFTPSAGAALAWVV